MQQIKSHKKLPLKRALLSTRMLCQQDRLLQTTALLDAGLPPRYPHKIAYQWAAWVPGASELLKPRDEMFTTLVYTCATAKNNTCFLLEWNLFLLFLFFLFLPCTKKKTSVVFYSSTRINKCCEHLVSGLEQLASTRNSSCSLVGYLVWISWR